MSFPDFQLLPADDPQTDPADDLGAAVAGAVALPDTIAPDPASPPFPFGVSWMFDWDRGQFVRAGTGPVRVEGLGALGEWCQMAIHSARYAHPVFSDNFGMEDPDSVIGEFAVGEALADWQRHLIEALLVHERITTVENVSLDWDPGSGILTILTMDIVTDEAETLSVSDITLQAGGQ